MERRVLLIPAYLLLALVWAGTAGAQQPTLAGKWSASAMQTQWNIGDWGAACGPKPSGGVAPAGTVTVTQRGSELTISGLGRSYSTTQCWEQFPGLNRTNHSGGLRAWSSVCKTAPSDPRQATVRTSIQATDSTIHFDETGQYQFLIKGQNCTASVRRTRHFTLLQREGDTAKPVETKAAEAAPKTESSPPPKNPSAASPSRCQSVGAPTRLEVRPARKLMRPGDAASFTSVILDAKGCSIGRAPKWEISQGGQLAELSAPGGLRIKDSAGEGEVLLSVSTGGQTVTVTVEVTSNERYEALLRQRGFNEKGESNEAATAVIASGSIGAGSAVSASERNKQRTWWLALGGGLLLLVGLGGFFLVQTRRKKAIAVFEKRKQSLPPQAQSSAAVRKKLCPVCGTEYPFEAGFCGKDGSNLVPMN